MPYPRYCFRKTKSLQVLLALFLVSLRITISPLTSMDEIRFLFENIFGMTELVTEEGKSWVRVTHSK
jgi:hypothetical protein